MTLQEKIEQLQAIRAEVHEKFPNVDFPEPSLQPLFFGRRDKRQYGGKSAIVDIKTDIPFSIVSDQYQLIYYEETVKMLEDIADELMEDFGPHETTIHLPYDKGRMRVELVFPEMEYEIKKGDHINPKMDVFRSYDLRWQYGGRFGAYRIICANGLTVGEVFASFKKRHIWALNPADLRDAIGEGISHYVEQTDIWKRWANRVLEPAEYEELWTVLPFSENEKETMEALPEAGSQIVLPEALNRNELSLWDMHSVVTQFLTHEVAGEHRRVEIEPQVANAFHNFYAKAA